MAVYPVFGMNFAVHPSNMKQNMGHTISWRILYYQFSHFQPVTLFILGDYVHSLLV